MFCDSLQSLTQEICSASIFMILGVVNVLILFSDVCSLLLTFKEDDVDSR